MPQQHQTTKQLLNLSLNLVKMAQTLTQSTKKQEMIKKIMDDSKMFGSSFTAINLTHVKEDNSVKS